MEIDKAIERESCPEKAKLLGRFFKTGKGEYGEGDIFLGIMVPMQREIAKQFKDLELENINKLLDSEIHEKRMIGLFILVDKYKKAEKAKDEEAKKEIFDFYLSNTRNINNWDLVDLSAPNIIGNYLSDKDITILYELAKSENLWERRISVLSTLAFIRENDFQDALKIAEILLNDKHDLIHKAVGWMLREIGKRDENKLIEFLDKYHKVMPRTMLRYSIEKLDKNSKERYMKR